VDHCSRRTFLKTSTALIATCLVPLPATAALAPESASRALAFFNTHTGERLGVTYFKNGAYRPDALHRIDRILRDHRTGDMVAMDRRLLDLLVGVQRRLAIDAPFHIISAYRSPQTNAMLRKQGSGVAKRSYHLLGRAIDIRLPGCDTHRLKRTCLALRGGGVGYYARSDFVHVDTGEIRTWSG
jgi:uncharacterized protein YcbK (DUF882 family)